MTNSNHLMVKAGIIGIVFFTGWSVSRAQGTCPVETVQLVRISGIVLTQGKPRPDALSSTYVYLRQLDSKIELEKTTTNQLGAFRFAHVPAGQYQLGVEFRINNIVLYEYDIQLIVTSKAHKKKLRIILGPDCNSSSVRGLR